SLRSGKASLKDLEMQITLRPLTLPISMEENSDDKDEEEVLDDEEETQVKDLTALADYELSVGKNHARNGEWIDITMKKGFSLFDDWHLSSSLRIIIGFLGWIVWSDTMNDDSPTGVAFVVREGVTPSVVDMTVEMGNNAPGKSSYANITSKPSRKKVNVRTLFTPGGNGIDVVVPVDSILAITERFANTAYGFFLGKNVTPPKWVAAEYGFESVTS
ncbi:hypothetical protein Tco_0522213, partial [Tanacetum coccineum]